MDEGPAISYLALTHDVSVFASDGNAVGTVEHVVAAPEKDIFHGIVVRLDGRLGFIAADDIAALHEDGVDLRIDRAAAAAAPEPHGAAPAWHDREPGVKPSRWGQVLDMFSGGDRWSRSWRRED